MSLQVTHRERDSAKAKECIDSSLNMCSLHGIVFGGGWALGDRDKPLVRNLDWPKKRIICDNGEIRMFDCPCNRGCASRGPEIIAASHAEGPLLSFSRRIISVIIQSARQSSPGLLWDCSRNPTPMHPDGEPFLTDRPRLLVIPSPSVP